MAPSVTTTVTTSRAGGLLADLGQRTGKSEAALVEVAVRALHRQLIGDDRAPQYQLPFKKRWSRLDADVVLRQVDAETFRLEEPFRYVPDNGAQLVVPQGDASDLASVPALLTWLVPRYGRHTLPALLHDHLVEPGMDPADRERADLIFRDSMGGAQVPFVRRWVMWAAVSLATLWRRRLPWKVAVVAWIVAALAVGFDLLFAVTQWYRIPVVSDVFAPWLLAAPMVASILWWRRYRFGLITAWALFLLPLSLVPVGLTVGLYLLAEKIAQLLLAAWRWRDPSVDICPVRPPKAA